MTQELQSKANIINSAELKELLGPPPILSSEDGKAYDEIAARLMECIEPRDFMEQLLIKQFVDSTWDTMRYARHKTLGIERKSPSDSRISGQTRQGPGTNATRGKRTLSCDRAWSHA